MIVKILHNNAIKHRIGVVLQNVQIASQRHQITFDLGGDILSYTPGTNTISRAMMAVPVFVFQDFRKIVLIVGS